MNITRFHNQEKLNVTIEFLTPTFLGGADQQGELRSPPFKNLLRQWWRIVNGKLSAKELCVKEGELFGTVLGDTESSASKVRIAVVSGAGISVSSQSFKLGRTNHPEVGGGKPVENSLYLGYGPVKSAKPDPIPKQYIVSGSSATLQVYYPRSHSDEILKALQYIDAFGTIGSRSRNGYGSLSLSHQSLSRLNPALIETVPLTGLMNGNKDYPNRFARDTDLLLWESGLQNNWESAMTLLAGTYLKTRTSINITGNSKELHERHALGYPVTNHAVANWGGGNGRMPSQLRLMVKQNGDGRLVARILHLPHKLPHDKPWPATLPAPLHVWQQVHRFLDTQNQFHRLGGGA